MARRQNKNFEDSASQNGTDVFSLPDQIPPSIDGINQDAFDFVNTLLYGYRFGNQVFDTKTPHHEDWIMLFVALADAAEGRATVTKSIVEITGRAYGTVRASLQRFERLGYLQTKQRIGRSQLYEPTDKMKDTLNEFADKFWPHVQNLRDAQRKKSGRKRG